MLEHLCASCLAESLPDDITNLLQLGHIGPPRLREVLDDCTMLGPAEVAVPLIEFLKVMKVWPLSP